MFLIEILQTPNVGINADFNNLGIGAFIILVIFAFIAFVIWQVRMYLSQKAKDELTSERFSGIDMFISSQSALNEKISNALEVLIKGITSEAPIEQCKLVIDERLDNDINRLVYLTGDIIEKNHIDNVQTTTIKINKITRDCYNNTTLVLKIFNYKNKPLSSYMDEKWIDPVVKEIEMCIFGDKNLENLRRNLDLVFDAINFEFNNNLTKEL